MRLRALALLFVACGGSKTPNPSPPDQWKPETPAAYLARYNADHDAFLAKLQPADSGSWEPPIPTAPAHPPVDTRPPSCIEAETLLARTTVLLDEATQYAAGVHQFEAQIADAQASIAREKANPSGVYDLHRLHTDGEIIQMSREEKAQAEALAKANLVEVRAINVKLAKSAAACKAARNAAKPSDP